MKPVFFRAAFSAQFFRVFFFVTVAMGTLPVSAQEGPSIPPA